MKYAMIAAVSLAVLGGGYLYLGNEAEAPAPTPQEAAIMPGAPLVEVTLPESLSENAQIGQRVFDAKCAACHGPNASGREGMAPPLVHKIYEPSHHGDEAFQRAAAQGVRGHHWRFGDMPAVSGVTRADIALVVAYVRELQRANGIN